MTTDEPESRSSFTPLSTFQDEGLDRGRARTVKFAAPPTKSSISHSLIPVSSLRYVRKSNDMMKFKKTGFARG